MRTWIIVRYLDDAKTVLEVVYNFTPERKALTFNTAKAAADYANKFIGHDKCMIAGLANPKNLLDVQCQVLIN